MSDQIGFVDTIAASPTVRLDLSDGTKWRVDLNGTDFTPPPLRRAGYSNFISDGEQVTASSYGDRIVTLALRLVTTDVDTVGQEVQKLAKEIDRANNLLRWWPDGASRPVFFETKRTDVTSLLQVLRTHHTVQLPIRAKPFALGLRETLSPVAVSNDPATGCYFDVPFPSGDVETPLYLAFTASHVVAAGRRQTVLAVRRRGSPGNGPFVLQAESMSLTGATTLPGADATASGSGSNYARATGLTSSFVTRLTGTFAPSAGTDVRGKYRMFARVRKTNAAGEVRMRLGLLPDGSNEYIPDGVGVVLQPDTVWRWADLGVIQIPFGDDPITDGPGGADLPAIGYSLRLAFSLTASSSNVDVDCLVGMPADDRMTRVLWPENLSGATQMILDPSGRPKVYAVDGANVTRNLQLRSLDSAPGPMVSPGSYNRVWMLLDTGGSSTAGDSIANSTTVTPYYWPRYLAMRPASS